MSSLLSSTAFIDLNALRYNAKLINNAASRAQLAAVVKANAYGHGAIEVSKALLDLVDLFCVARVHEAIQLREAGIGTDILVFTPVSSETSSLYKAHNLIATVSNFEAFALLPIGSRVHLNMDTGMGRLGFLHNQIGDLKKAIQKYETILQIEGIYSHFSDAESPQRYLTKAQLEQFKHIVDQFSERKWMIHLANSASIANLPTSHFHTIRSGIALYGYDEGFQFNQPLQPVLKWQSNIVECRKIREGWPISYGATWQAKEDGYVGVIPVGYADGLNRGLSNRIYFADADLGIRYQQIGRITMDHCMIWLGHEPLEVGTKIDLLNGFAMNAKEWAKLLQTIPYEIVCAIGSRVERAYIDPST